MFSSGLSIIIAIAGVIFTVGTIISIILLIKDLITKKRYFHTNGFKDIASILFAIALIAGIFYLLYNAPFVLFYGETWEMVDEFGPSSLINAAAAIIAVVPLFYIYYLLECFFPKKQKNRPYFMIITLSIASGLGNTMVVFIINQALGRVMGSESRWAAIDSGLGIFLAIGIILFTVCSYIVRKRLIKITSEVVYDKRVEIIDKIGKAPFDKFEALEDGKVYATLNNDTETVSGVVTALINGLSGII
ncbi:MAG TPA: cyclic peptide export ABC transporter, partial [Ruminiclostridium sp.]|nr:cyclic peptide export ABC transporter [Ruminiclostridium sp.]